MKGAFCYRALEKRVRVDALTQALSAFYNEKVGQPAGMRELLDTSASHTGDDPSRVRRPMAARRARPRERRLRMSRRSRFKRVSRRTAWGRTP